MAISAPCCTAQGGGAGLSLVAIPADAPGLQSAAKYRGNGAARCIGQGAMALHGGMGVTRELPPSDDFKRLAPIELMPIELTLSDADDQLERLSRNPDLRRWHDPSSK